MLPRDVASPLWYSERGANIWGSLVDASLSILAEVKRDVTPFAMGCPGPVDLPVEEVAAIAAEVLAGAGAQALNYIQSEGHPGLRDFVVDMFRADGVPVERENVIITAGGMQGLDLVAKLFVQPGDPVAVERPSYGSGLATISNYRGILLPIDLDGQGLDVERLEEALAEWKRRRRPVKLAYVIPNFQNPSGITMSRERREKLLDIAHEQGLLILEDDPYRRLRFGGVDLPSLLSLDDGAHVIHVGTFSKVIAPGLRCGYVVGPARVIAKMVDAKQSMDTCANTLGQHIVAEFCRRGYLATHVDRLISSYRGKRDTMLGALKRYFPEGGFSWTNPQGGMFLWMRLPEGLSANRLFETALEEGVAFIPGSAFDLTRGETNQLRLCYSFPNVEDIHEGVKRLRRAVDRCLADSGELP